MAQLYLTDPLPSLDNIGGVMASGGVAEYIYGREARDFGDMGRRLGRAIRRRFDVGALPWALLPAGSAFAPPPWAPRNTASSFPAIRATSPIRARFCRGAICRCSSRRFCLATAWTPTRSAEAIRAHRKAFEAEDADSEIALAFHWQGAPSYERIFACARGIAAGLADKVAAKKPIYVMLDGDIAHTLGAILREDCKVMSDILCIDGVMLMDFDYIDLGRVRVPSYTVPVTIKSLVFSDDPKRTRERIHHHDHDHGHDHHHHHPMTVSVFSSPLPGRSNPGLDPGEGGRRGRSVTAAEHPAVGLRKSSTFDAKWLIIGAAVLIVAWLALVPLVFLVWQSFMTPLSPGMPALFTLANYSERLHQLGNFSPARQFARLRQRRGRAFPRHRHHARLVE